MTLHSQQSGASLHSSKVNLLAGNPAALNEVATIPGELAIDNSVPSSPQLWRARTTVAGEWDRISGGGGGSSGFLLYLPGTNAPVENLVEGVEVLDFDYLSSQELFGLLPLPANYVATTQIFLKDGMFAASAVTNKVFFKAETKLIRAGTTVLGSLGTAHVSTNAAVTVSGTTNELTAIGDLDLTNSSGEINAVPVAGGDVLIIRLFRDSSNESPSAASDARLIRRSLRPDLG